MSRVVTDEYFREEFVLLIVKAERSNILEVGHSLINRKVQKVISVREKEQLDLIQRMSITALKLEKDEELTKFIIQDQSIINLLSNDQDRLDFLKNLILPWLQSFKPNFRAEEVF